MTKTIYPATLLCDFYKVSHKEQYPEGTEFVYSTFTPRSNRYFPLSDEVVVFGVQAFIKKYLIGYFNTHFFNRDIDSVVNEYVRYIENTLGKKNPDASHIVDLHRLGYLPIEVRVLPEGTLAPIKTPIMAIENTDPNFFWITNYLETLVSNEIWLPMTSATIAHTYRTLLEEYSIKTTGNTDGVGFQGHDFSMRGMGAFEASIASGAGHLLSFTGTDTIPAISYLEEYYNANIENELVGASIPATEHSVMCSYGAVNEFDLFKHLMTNVYPDGFFSVVSDTWDFWKVIGEYLPKLKNEILNRDGRVVIRPDSGDPVEIICGKVFEEFAEVEEAVKYLRGKVESIADEASGKDVFGDDYYTERFKVGSKYYKVTYEVSYNRHDKTFYYVDGVKKTSLKEYEPKLEELGLIEALWNIFDGTLTEQGYKVLDGHIGAIYGDSITIERARAILERLEEKGFASTNIVFGIGSYTYQYNTRDTFGFAMKATHAQVKGEERMLFKDPKTDDGTKKSQRGRVVVFKNTIDNIVFVDGYDKESDDNTREVNLLKTVFKNGELLRDESLAEIRARLNG